MHIDVIMPGSPVRLAAGHGFNDKGDIRAVVLAVMIEENRHVSYKCSWWSGREHKSEWLGSIEVSGDEGTAEMKIGFKT